MKILVTIPKSKGIDSFVPPVVQARLSELGEVYYNEASEQFTQEELRERLRGKDVVITGWGAPFISETVLNGNDSLKVIAHTGGTVQSVVDEYAYDKGVRVLSGNNLYAESVAESVIAYALAALRKIPDYMELTRKGHWNNEIPVWEGLLNQRLGIVGYGMTSRHLVKMLKPFQCEILVYSSHISDEELAESNLKRASLEEIFSSCKIISLHSAMTPQNHHMIDRRLLNMIDSEAILINTARGGLIDEPAMTELLLQNRFRAVLDVFEKEPLPPQHKLRTAPGTYIIPHRAGPTYDRRKLVTLALADDIENFFAGKPLKLEITKEYAGFMTWNRK